MVVCLSVCLCLNVCVFVCLFVCLLVYSGVLLFCCSFVCMSTVCVALTPPETHDRISRLADYSLSLVAAVIVLMF